MSWPTLSDGKFLPLATLMDNVFKVCFQAAESAVCWHTIRETWIENPRVQMFVPLPSLLLLPKFDIQPQQPCLYALLVKPLYLKPISVALQERQTGNRYIRGWGVIPISLAVGWTGRSTDTHTIRISTFCGGKSIVTWVTQHVGSRQFETACWRQINKRNDGA